MSPVFLTLALSLVAADVEPVLRPGVELHYRGTVAKVDPDRTVEAAGKSFDVAITVAAHDAEGTEYLWQTTESGAGTFGWAERFGRLRQSADGTAPAAEGPALLYDYGKGKHVVPLPAPLLKLPEKPEAGQKWEVDGLELEIVRAQNAAGRACWVVELRNQFGLQGRAWVDQESQLVLQREAKVFMDQGTEYRLALELADVEQLAAADATQRQADFTALLQLRDKLKRPARTIDAKLSGAQLKTLAAALPAAREAVKGPTVRLLVEADRDLKAQAGRTSALDKLRAEQQGRTPGKFSLAGLDGAELASDELAGAVTVLHFWDYRDEPLKEPYGQVGYLEFLYGKHKDAGLKLYGVAVDTRFAKPDTARTAGVGVRKFKNFMNLSYPILFDAGDLIREFGDPRLQGGELPLFVVIGPDGKIAHYKVGHYAVDREAGLAQLNGVVKSLLPADKNEEPKP